MAEDIIARRDRRRDLHHPGVIVGNHLVRAPHAGDGFLLDDSDAVDLEELQRGLVDGLAAAVAAREVVDHGAVVALWPGGPLQADLVAGCDDGVAARVGRVQVADDVVCGEGVGRDEAVGCVGRLPGDDHGGVGVVGVGADVPPFVADSVDHDVGDVAVGGYLGG